MVLLNTFGFFGVFFAYGPFEYFWFLGGFFCIRSFWILLVLGVFFAYGPFEYFWFWVFFLHTVLLNTFIFFQTVFAIPLFASLFCMQSFQIFLGFFPHAPFKYFFLHTVLLSTFVFLHKVLSNTFKTFGWAIDETVRVFPSESELTRE